MIKVKRVKVRGKFRVYVFENGKIATHSKWTPKVPLIISRNIFQRTGTLMEDFYKIKRTNVNMFQDFSKKPMMPKEKFSKKFQYVVEGTFPNGERIYATSQSYDLTYSVAEAKAEAFESFYERLAQSQGKDYSASIGEPLVDSLNVNIRHGIQYFRDR